MTKGPRDRFKKRYKPRQTWSRRQRDEGTNVYMRGKPGFIVPHHEHYATPAREGAGDYRDEDGVYRTIRNNLPERKNYRYRGTGESSAVLDAAWEADTDGRKRRSSTTNTAGCRIGVGEVSPEGSPPLIKEILEIVHQFELAGCRVEKGRRSSHYKVFDPSGRLVTSISSTPKKDGMRKTRTILRNYLAREAIMNTPVSARAVATATPFHPVSTALPAPTAVPDLTYTENGLREAARRVWEAMHRKAASGPKVERGHESGRLWRGHRVTVMYEVWPRMVRDTNNKDTRRATMAIGEYLTASGNMELVVKPINAPPNERPATWWIRDQWVPGPLSLTDLRKRPAETGTHQKYSAFMADQVRQAYHKRGRGQFRTRDMIEALPDISSPTISTILGDLAKDPAEHLTKVKMGLYDWMPPVEPEIARPSPAPPKVVSRAEAEKAWKEDKPSFIPGPPATERKEAVSGVPKIRRGELPIKSLRYLQEHPRKPFEAAEVAEAIGASVGATRNQLNDHARMRDITGITRPFPGGYAYIPPGEDDIEPGEEDKAEAKRELLEAGGHPLEPAETEAPQEPQREAIAGQDQRAEEPPQQAPPPATLRPQPKDEKPRKLEIGDVLEVEYVTRRSGDVVVRDQYGVRHELYE